MQPNQPIFNSPNRSMSLRPYSATILAACGLIMIGIGLYFILVRPSFLPEDARNAGASLKEIQAVAPGFARWLGRVFWVLGGYIAATGILTLYIATTSFRTRAKGVGVAVGAAGIASIGMMATVNVLINSDFKLPLIGLGLLWTSAAVLYWRNL